MKYLANTKLKERLKAKELRNKGLSLKEIGLMFDPPVSKQRVHQLLNPEREELKNLLK